MKASHSPHTHHHSVMSRLALQPVACLWLLLLIPACYFCSAISFAAEPPSARQLLNLKAGGVDRTYVVHVPANSKMEKRLPVVIMLHGGGGTANATIWETGWTDKADQEGFLAVFPNALARNPTKPSSFVWNPQLWNDGSDRFYPDQKVSDDTVFFAALLDELEARYPVDKDRIYVSGFSNGASMSFLLGANLSARIAAIAPVAGACWITPSTMTRPVPLLYITGRNDPLNLIDGGVPKMLSGAKDPIRAKPKPPVMESILKWAKAIGCSTTPSSVTNDSGLRTEMYGPCRDGAEIVYLLIDDHGHTWAGGRSLLPERMVGKCSNRINTTDVIWNFFQKHPRTDMSP